MSKDVVSVLKNPAVRSGLRMYRLIKRIQRAGNPFTVVEELFRDAPPEVRKTVKKVIDVAITVSNSPDKDPEDVAREIGIAMGIPEDQVEDFIDTVMPIAELIASMIKKEEKEEIKIETGKKFITPEETDTTQEEPT
jgi:hypothetical protein